jgi:hypothetical protein
MKPLVLVAAALVAGKAQGAERVLTFETSACMAWLGDWRGVPQGVCRLRGGIARCTLGDPGARGYTGAVVAHRDEVIVEARHDRHPELRIRVACEGTGPCRFVRGWNERTGFRIACSTLARESF